MLKLLLIKNIMIIFFQVCCLVFNSYNFELKVSYLVVTPLFESEFLSTKLHCNKAILYLVVLEYLKIGTYF